MSALLIFHTYDSAATRMVAVTDELDAHCRRVTLRARRIDACFIISAMLYDVARCAALVLMHAIFSFYAHATSFKRCASHAIRMPPRCARRCCFFAARRLRHTRLYIKRYRDAGCR